LNRMEDMVYTATSTTRWRDKSIVPQDYEDVAVLVGIARKARAYIVEFDWAFSEEDLKGLRRVFYEWGSRTVGRYKCCGARVLKAVNDALGETDSIFVRNEPKNSQGVDCQVSCVRDGDVFRLRGYAPFDIVFGYGYSTVENDPVVTAFLGPDAQGTLANAVEMLGWDLRRLHEHRLTPVRNVLFGMRLDYGMEESEPSGEPAVDVHVHFHGPFSAVSEGKHPCLFADELARRNGVYLWTINVGAEEWPWYVGQTRRGFGARSGEHLAGFLSGQYTTYDVSALARGENRRAPGSSGGEWPRIIPAFLRDYESLVPNIIGLIRLVSFHVAPLVGDRHLYDRVEGAIGRYYKTHPDPPLREFFSPGIRVPGAIPGDKPIRIVLSSDAPIAGLPSHLLA